MTTSVNANFNNNIDKIVNTNGTNGNATVSWISSLKNFPIKDIPFIGDVYGRSGVL